jgi:hypothetical protein
MCIPEAVEHEVKQMILADHDLLVLVEFRMDIRRRTTMI